MWLYIDAIGIYTYSFVTKGTLLQVFRGIYQPKIGRFSFREYVNVIFFGYESKEKGENTKMDPKWLPKYDSVACK